MRIFSVEIRNPRSCPEPLVERTLHIIRYERGSTQRTSPLVVSHPTVETTLVEDVTAVCELSDLILTLELVQADGATLRRVHQLRELDHREDFTHQKGGHGVKFRDSGGLVLPCPAGIVGFNEILETHTAEEERDELSDETQKGKCVEEQFWKEELCVAHWEPHV